MRDEPASHHLVFEMLCDSSSKSNDRSSTRSLAMKSDTRKSLQEQCEEHCGDSFCCDSSLEIIIRTNPLYGIDIHDMELPGSTTGREVHITHSVSKYHVLDSPRDVLPVSPVCGPLSQKKENMDPKRLSYAIDSKIITERKYEGAANYWQERAKYEEIRARLVRLQPHHTHKKSYLIYSTISFPTFMLLQASWDLAQERRHSESRLVEERRKSAR